MLYKHSKNQNKINDKVSSRTKKIFKRDSIKIDIKDSITGKMSTNNDSKMKVHTFPDPIYGKE